MKLQTLCEVFSHIIGICTRISFFSPAPKYSGGFSDKSDSKAHFEAKENENLHRDTDEKQLPVVLAEQGNIHG